MRAAVLFVLVGMLAMLALVTPVAAESPVKNLVFVMLENRGFDHRLGYLKSLYPELDGLNGNESNFVNPKLRTGLCKVNDSGDPYGSPNGGHSYHSTLNEQYGTTDVKPPYSPPPMDGFALNENSCDVMESIPVDDIPVSRSFIDNFMILDKWFPGFPGPTEVNRMHFHSGTSEGWCDNPTDEEYVIGYPQESLVHHLEANNITWRVYMSDMVSTLLMFKDVRSPHMLKNFHSYERFKLDAARGELPQYSLIEPRFFSVKGLPSNDEHPKEHCIYQGELLYKSIYDNLRASPQWNTSALLITYDEHGGLYDHVPSPTGVPPPSPGLNCSRKGGDPYYDYTRLGIRVPAFLISPWVKKGHIEHYPNTGKTTPPPGAPQYTHSTQLATCRDVFGIPGNLTTRVSWAASLAPLFTEKEARTDAPMTMPQPPKGTPEQISKMDNEWKQPINHLQEDLMRQMAALNGRLLSEETQLPQTEAEGSEYALGHYEAFRKSLGL